MTKIICKDCLAEGRIGKPLNAPFPGPRCYRHHHAWRGAQKQRAREARILARFGMTPEEYDRLKEFQGGVCYICQTAKGVTKALAIEHDHATLLWRGLACGPCNWLLAKLGDDPAQFDRIAEALRNPPAVRLFGKRKVGIKDGSTMR
jgi:hypothetical protein